MIEPAFATGAPADDAPRTGTAFARALPLTMALLLIGAFILRATGAGFGLPYSWHPDEHFVLLNAQGMLQEGRLLPGWYKYPSLYLYLQAAVEYLSWLGVRDLPGLASLADLPNGYADGHVYRVTHPDLWRNGRLLSAALGALAAVLTALAGRRLFGTAAGLLAGLFLAVLPHHVEHSRYVAVNVPMSAAAAGALLASAIVLRTGSGRALVAAAACVGLAIGCKYNAGALMAVPMAAWALAPRRPSLPWLLAVPVVAGLTLLATMPAWLIEPRAVVADIMAEVSHYKEGGISGGNVQPGLEHLGRIATELGWRATRGLGLLALPGLVVAARTDRRATALLLVGPVVYLGAMSGTQVFFDRNVLVVEPVLAVLAALPVAALGQALQRRLPASAPAHGALWAGLALALVAWPARASLERATQAASAVDSRVQLADWIRAEQQPGWRVGVGPALFLDASTLHDISLVQVDLERPETWAAAGATHVIGGPKARVVGTGRPVPEGVRTSSLEAAAGWWASRQPVIAFGSAPWKTNGWGANPRVGLYAVEPAEGPSSAGAPAAAMVSADADGEPAGGPSGDWSFDPQDAAGATRARAVTLRAVGDPTRSLSACHGDTVKVDGPLTLSGQWRWSETNKKAGSRSQLVVQWEDGKGQPLKKEKARESVAHANPGDGHWKRVSETLEPPPAGRQARICLRARLAGGAVEAQGLRLEKATGAVAASAPD